MSDARTVEQRLAALEDGSAVDADLLGRVARKVGLAAPVGQEAREPTDTPVWCPNCGTKQGYYDADEDL